MRKSSILLLALAIGVTPAIAQNQTYRNRNNNRYNNNGYYNGQNNNNGYYSGQNNNGYYNGQNNSGYYNGQNNNGNYNGNYNNNGYYRNGANNPGYDTPGERNLPDRVDIIGSPQVQVGRGGARIYWQTNNVAATDVWLVGGDINGHRTAYQRGGSRDHSVSFRNLRPNTTYTYLIRSNRGNVRYEGNFTTR
jgi:hypothetical protein